VKRDRIAVWLDANDEVVRRLKYDTPPKERGEVVRKALKLFWEQEEKLKEEVKSLREKLSLVKSQLEELRNAVDENACILGEEIVRQLKIHFPDREVDDELVQAILTRGIRQLKKEEEEREKAELLKLQLLFGGKGESLQS
jgi:predicted RNase H-like nuclease (RuvC/YqgF family)